MCGTVAVVSKKMPARFADEVAVGDVGVGVVNVGSAAETSVGGGRVDGLKRRSEGCLG